MEKVALLILEILKAAPLGFTLFLGTLAAVIAAWFYIKKISITERTTVGDIQSKQVEMLITQLKAQSEEIQRLGEQLTEARKELHALYEQNVDLMKRIRELEDLLRNKS
jgi:uncharacterized protein involved in cysteine biosynthesis